MKLLLSIALCLLSLLSYGQLPTIPTQEQGFWRILDQEQDLIDLSGFSDGSSTPGTVGQLINASAVAVPYGLVAVVHSITITSDGPCSISGYLRKGYYSNSNQKATSPLLAVFGPNGGTATFNYGEKGVKLVGGGQVSVIKVLTTTTNPTVKIYVSNKAMSDDAHPNAKFAHVSIGNSMSWGTLGTTASGYPNMGETHFTARINSALRLAGIDSRKALRGFGGSVAQHWVQAIDAGLLKNQQMDLVSIMLATNEAATQDVSVVDATTGMTYSQMIQYIVDYIYAQNASASVVLIGPPPSSTVPRVTNLPGYRTATAAIVALPKYTGKDLFYYDASGNITQPTTTDVNFVETGTAAQIHLRGDTGHLKVYQGLWPVIQQTKFYINNVNLTKPLAP